MIIGLIVDILIVFFETSAKKDENIMELFVALANALPESAGRSFSTASAGSIYKVHVPERQTSCCGK
jgi:type IV secretory pathway VirB3-like protein